MLDMSSSIPIFTTPSEILSSAWPVNVHASNSAAPITADLFIVPSRVAGSLCRQPQAFDIRYQIRGLSHHALRIGVGRTRPYGQRPRAMKALDDRTPRWADDRPCHPLGKAAKASTFIHLRAVMGNGAVDADNLWAGLSAHARGAAGVVRKGSGGTGGDRRRGDDAPARLPRPRVAGGGGVARRRRRPRGSGGAAVAE